MRCTRQVDGLVVDDAYKRALRQHPELIQSMLVCCRRKLQDVVKGSTLENQDGQEAGPSDLQRGPRR